MNRFDRIVALLIQLQTRRVVSGPALAERFGVSLRTIYRDLRTLEQAGVPLLGEPGVGYSLAAGYRLPPVLFTRAEATALLTAEKLAARFTDAPTARLSTAAMDKVRAVLRHADRDYVESLTPQIHVGGPIGEQLNPYQQLVGAVAARQVVRLHYRPTDHELPTQRDVEPIGLYLTQYWHVVAYCRLRQDFRNFRLDRIAQLTFTGETFAERSETLQQYWQQRARDWPRERVVVQFRPAGLLSTLVQRLHDTKRQYGWAYETPLPNRDGVEMTFYIGSLEYLAAWLLPYAGAMQVLEPPALLTELARLAQRAQTFFGDPPVC